MNAEPVVSVIIPTYNRAGEVCQAIENVFQQTYKNVEVIVVDDGSVDDTQSALLKFGDRIRIVTQDNAGPSAARNHGFEVSRGDIIAFQDSDDLWKPTKLARQVALLQKYGPSVPCCLCSAFYRFVDGKPLTSFDIACIDPSQESGLWINVAEVLATRTVLFNQTTAIRRASFEQSGGFDQSLTYQEDYDLPLKLASQGPWAFIREPLVIYRENMPDSFGRKAANDAIVLKECEIAIFERALKRAAFDHDVRLERQLTRRLRVFRRLLIAAQLRGSPSAFARTTGSAMERAERVREQIFRRTLWYPKLLTAQPPLCNDATVPLEAVQTGP